MDAGAARAWAFYRLRRVGGVDVHAYGGGARVRGGPGLCGKPLRCGMGCGLGAGCALRLVPALLFIGVAATGYLVAAGAGGGGSCGDGDAAAL